LLDAQLNPNSVATRYNANQELISLASEILGCEKCQRLRSYCELIGVTKRKAFRDWDYWKKPLPGFGDRDAKVLVIGLAPAANGGTRTGRLFCGDSSGDWLVRALHQTGFANQPTSVSKDDGLELSGVYLTAVVRCAPPENKPSRVEMANCLPYLGNEIRCLQDLRIVLALGEIAFEGFMQVLRKEFELHLVPKPKFRHGAVYNLGTGYPKLFVSYHPSRRNTQTGVLTWPMWIRTFRSIRHELDKNQTLQVQEK
jgi:uracil-DNA glycosylase